ncbi:MAG TPA: peptide ABC transporter permease, partial [Chloroflexi bacterium]|nr:peptide ABC transporter permease [Chloroflexota bacterium]
MRRFRKHKLAMLGAVVIGLLVLMAILAPVISPENFINW